MENKKNYLIWMTPAGLIILNFILKVLFISANPVSGDEPFSIFHAQLDFPLIIQQLSYYNNPPLFEIILHLWIKLFGISEVSVRFPSLIFSVLTVYFIYKTGKEFFTYRIAVITSLLFTFSNYHVLFSHEARVYALFALLTAMSMYFFMTIVKKNNDIKYYFLLLAINALLLYSHYFGFFVIIIQSIAFLLLEECRKKGLNKYLIYLVLLIVFYIPHINILMERFVEATGHGTWLKAPIGIESIYNMLWKFSNQPATTVISIFILLAAFVKIIIKKEIKIISSNTKIVLTWFLFPFFSMFIISYWIPMFLDRYLIFVSLGYYFVLAICADYIIGKPRYSFILPAILVVFFVATFNPNVDNKRLVKETIAKIKILKDKNTIVIMCPQYFILNFAYYYNREIFQDIDMNNVYAKMTETLKRENIVAVNTILEADLNGYQKILYLDAAASFAAPGNNILPSLNKTNKLRDTYKYYEMFTVYEFEKK
jgi:4-amino-4-deoxy-L-arabinose transferase-like glycosyltransferase